MTLIMHLLTTGVLLVVMARVLRHCNNIVLSSHAILFFSYTYIYELAAIGINQTEYEMGPYLLTSIAISFYILFLLLAPMRVQFNDYLVSDGFPQISEKNILSAMVLWFAMKVYLLGKYGITAFMLLSDTFSTISTIDIIIDSFVTYIAVGASLVLLIRTAQKMAVHLVTRLVWLNFLILYGLYSSAFRRFVALNVIVYVYAAFIQAEAKISRKMIAILTALVVISYFAFAGYQQIRGNLFLADDEITNLVDVYQLLTREAVSDTTLGENIAVRNSPFPIHYQITKEQMETGTIADGQILRQSLENAVPKFIMPHKQYSSVKSEIVPSYYSSLPFADLNTTLVSLIQADYGYVYVMIAPAIVLAVTTLLLKAADRMRHNKIMLLALIGGMAMVMLQVETTLDTFFVLIRDLLLLYAVSSVIMYIGGAVYIRSGASAHAEKTDP